MRSAGRPTGADWQAQAVHGGAAEAPLSASAPAPLGRDADRRFAFALCGGLAVIAFAVYLRTLAPSIPTGDSGELITVAWVLGVAHPSGYPLFTILGHLFTFLPLGSPAFRVNLMSAVFHAATIGIVTWTIYCLLESRPGETAAASSLRAPRLIAAAVAGLALAFSNAFWAYAVVAEVFALNSFFAALILCLLLEWEHCPQRTYLLYTFALASGLAATNHHTIVFLAPACLVLLISGANKLLSGRAGITMRPFDLVRRGAIAAGLVVVGLLPYLYLPLAASADPPLNWGDPRTLDAFFHHFLRADYGTFHLTVADRSLSGSALVHIGLLLRGLYDGFTPLGCGLAVLGAWSMIARARSAGLAIGLAFVFTGPVFVAFANPYIDNPILYGVLERFYILPSVFVAIIIGIGTYEALIKTMAMTPRMLRRAAAATVAVLLLANFAVAFVLNFERADQSGNTVDLNFGEDMLSMFDTGALFIVDGDAATMVTDYLQLVEGRRPDLVTVNIEKLKLASYVRQLRRRHPELAIPFDVYVPGGDQLARFVQANWNSRPVYLLGQPKEPGFFDRYDVVRAGFAGQLLPKGSAPDLYAVAEKKLDLLRTAHFPTRLYPETTFEASIVESYGALAFDIAHVLDDGVREAEAIAYYRVAIKLVPKSAPAYKNLGLVLFNRGAAMTEVAPLWEQFLRLAPDDPQAAAIRQRLAMGRAAASPR